MTHLTIISIVKNDATRLKKTIASMEQQSNHEAEWLIWDNFSDDGTAALLNTCVYQNLRHVVRADNGIYDAMNLALKEAKGEWILFLHAGDELVGGHAMVNMINAVENSNASLLFADVYYGNEFVKQNGLVEFGVYRSLCHQAILMSKEQLGEQFYFKLDYKVASDFDLLVRLREAGVGFEKMSTPFSRYETGGFSDINYSQALTERKSIFKRQLRNPVQLWLNLFNLRRLQWKYNRVNK